MNSPVVRAAVEHAVLNTVTDAIFAVDASWRFTYVNEAALQLLKLSERDVLGMELWQVWITIRSTVFEVKWRYALGTATPDQFEAYWDEEETWFDVRCTLNKKGMTVQMRDCTAQKKAEEALRKRDNRLTALLERLPAGAVVVHGEGVMVNSRVEDMLGYPAETFKTLDDWFSVTRGGDDLAVAKAKADYISIKKHGFRTDVIVELLHADGTKRLADISAWEDELGEIWLLNDVTEKLASDEKFQKMFEQASDAHVLVDESGIIDCNQAALDLLGAKRKEDLLHKRPSEFSPVFQPDGRPSEDKCAEVNALAKRDGSHRFEWTHQSMSGRLLPSEVTITELTISGRPAQLVAWRDLTVQKETETRLQRNADELKRMTEQLQAANAQLTEARDGAMQADRAKSGFLATVSHEIRTPLNGVVGMTNLLLQTRLTAEQGEYVRTILASGQTLLRVVNDVLDLSKVEAGKLTIEPSEVELIRIVEETVRLFQAQADEKRIRMSVVSSCPKLHMLADAVRVKQVLGNLVMNALKFTHRGEVNVEIEALGPASGRTVRISVCDTGVGVPAARLDAIFESFTQADRATQADFGGTGLGLTISKRLVELMGGRIWVESEIGVGSTFTMELPLREVTPSRPEARQDSRRMFENLHVLVAEDNIVNALVARKQLERLGCTVTIAKCGMEAVAVGRDQNFDLVLMDLRMPGQDGIAATRQLLAKKPSLPIVALTANAMEEDRQACEEAGMIGFITKPMSSQELTDVLEQVNGPVTAPSR